MGSENSGGGERSGGLISDRARHIDPQRELAKRGKGGGIDRRGPSISRSGSSTNTPAGPQGGGGDGGVPAPIVNPVIINQAPASAGGTTQAPDEGGAVGTGAVPSGAAGTGRGASPSRSLLTLGFAETARKTLLGL